LKGKGGNEDEMLILSVGAKLERERMVEIREIGNA
jgi:hypothetical protein